MKRILIAGVGTIFLGDDGFGVEVAQQLSRYALPPEMHVIKFGIRTEDLAYALGKGFDATILIHTTSQSDPLGTLRLVEPDLKHLERFRPNPASSSPTTAGILHIVAPMVRRTGRLFLIGCEAPLLNSTQQLGLSGPVSAAIPRALKLVETVIYNLLNESHEVELMAA
jgi:hydrogenase maturation protease